MQTTQLELSLWDNLEQASATAETADLDHLWQELEAAISLLPHEHRLQTDGKVITQIVKVFALRCDYILSAWEEAHNEHGPAVDEDAIAGLVRQTMNLDLSELMEVPAPEQRQPRSASVASVSGPVEGHVAEGVWLRD
jgi:ATP-dependent Clp protease ATP-binding subunit ClpA